MTSTTATKTESTPTTKHVLPSWLSGCALEPEATNTPAVEQDERQKLVAELEELDAEHKRTVPPLKKTADEKYQSVVKARESLEKVEADYMTAKSAEDHARASIESRRNKIQKRLRSGVEPTLQPMLRRLHDKVERLANRKRGPAVTKMMRQHRALCERVRTELIYSAPGDIEAAFAEAAEPLLAAIREVEAR